MDHTISIILRVRDEKTSFGILSFGLGFFEGELRILGPIKKSDVRSFVNTEFISGFILVIQSRLSVFLDRRRKGGNAYKRMHGISRFRGYVRNRVMGCTERGALLYYHHMDYLYKTGHNGLG